MNAHRREPRHAMVPDPTHAHGAWIYLFASVTAGALVGSKHGVERAMLVGTGFSGAFLLWSALTMGLARRRRQALVGVTFAVAAPALALWLDASRGFLVVGAAAAVLATAAVHLAKTRGSLSIGAVSTSIAALGAAAPAAAVAGGASPGRSALLFGLLWLFFSWRSLRIAVPLQAGGRWDPVALRARGLREAAVAAVWTLGVTVALTTF